jgi:hypothetical protein
MRHSEELVRSEHRQAYEDTPIPGGGRAFCSCGWWSPIAPADERPGILARHVKHAVNAEEWCWGDQEKARQRYYQIENGVRI